MTNKLFNKLTSIILTLLMVVTLGQVNTLKVYADDSEAGDSEVVYSVGLGKTELYLDNSGSDSETIQVYLNGETLGLSYTASVTKNSGDDVATTTVENGVITVTGTNNAYGNETFTVTVTQTNEDDEEDAIGTASFTVNVGCKITFNANDGSNVTSTQIIRPGGSTALKTNTFTREGYAFKGWNTSADGTGTSYTDGESITLSSGITLYAQWEVSKTYVAQIGENKYESLADAFTAANAATSDCEITLLQDQSLSITSIDNLLTVNNANAKVTLNLADKTLNLTKDFDNNDCTLIWIKTSFDLKGSEGTINFDFNGHGGHGIYVDGSSTIFTMYDGVTINALDCSATDYNYPDRIISINYGSKGYFKGGKIVSDGNKYVSVIVNDGSDVCISGGKYQRTNTGGSDWGGLLDSYNAGTFSITGGYFDGVLMVGSGNGFQISGGTYTTTTVKDNKTLSNYVDTGYHVNDNGNGTYTVTNEYTITYNTNGGSDVASTTGTALPTTLPTTTKDGYKFDGWYTDEDLTTAVTAGATISANTTLYAKWSQYVAQIGSDKYTSLADAVAAVSDDGTQTTITLLADSTVTSTINIASGKNIVLDVAGKTISGSDKLLINNGTLKITGEGTMTTSGAIILENYGTLTMENGTLSSTCDASTAGSNSFIYNNNHGTLTIKSGTINAPNVTHGICNDDYATTILGDQSTHTGPTINNSGYTFVVRTNSTLTVYGGYYNNSARFPYDSTATIKLYGGYYSQSLSAFTAAATSGGYADALNASNSIAIANSDTTYQTKVIPGNGSKEDPYLVSTQEEIRAAFNKGGYVKLADNITFTDATQLEQSCLHLDDYKTVTLDLNGKTITGCSYEEGKGSIASDIINVITVQENATLTINDSSADKTGKIKTTDTSDSTCFYRAVLNRGALTVNGGTICSTTGEKGYGLYDYLGTATITGGTFKGYPANGNYGFVIGKNESGAEQATATISSGTFDVNPASNWLATGYHSVANGTNPETWTVNNVYSITYNLDDGTNAESNPTNYTYGTGVAFFVAATKTGYTFDGWYDANNNKVESISKTTTGDVALTAKWTQNPVAQIGSTTYVTLADAISAASANDEIDLLADITEDIVIPATFNGTIDLNGHKLTNVSSDTITVNLGATLVINDSSENKTGTVDNITNGKAAIYNKGTVTLNGGTYTRSAQGDNNAYYVILQHGTMTINDGVNISLNSKTSTLVDNGYYIFNGGSNSRENYISGEGIEYPALTITGGTLSGGMYNITNDDNATLNISGGNFIHSADNSYPLIYNQYITNISGGTFNAGSNTNEAIFSWRNSTQYNKGQTSITAGSFIGTITKTKDSTCTIQGGTFSVDPSEYLVENYEATKINGMWAVSLSSNIVAKIGDVYYTSLADAAKVAVSDQTIELIKDITDTGSISLAACVTLDGKGFKISGNSSIKVNAAGGTIQNVDFESIHNTTAISSSDKTKYGFSDNKVGTLSAVYASNLTGALTVTGCTFNNVDWDALQITPTGSKSVINITNNTFKQTDSDVETLRYIHIEGQNGYVLGVASDLTIQGNKFYKSTTTGWENLNYIGSWFLKTASYVSTKLTGNYFEYNATDGYVDTCTALGSGKSSTANISDALLFPAMDAEGNELNVAQVIDTKGYFETTYKAVIASGKTGAGSYATIQEAINAAGTSAEIKVIADTEEDFTIPEGKTITLNLYTSDNGAKKLNGAITNNGTLVIDGTTDTPELSSTITNNGTLSFNKNTTAVTYTTVVNNGTFKISSGKGTYDLSKFTNNEGGTITISAGTFNAEPNSDWVAEWYKATKNDNDTYTVAKENFDDAIEDGAIAASSATYSSTVSYYKTLDEITGTSFYLLKDLTDINAKLASGTTKYMYLNGHDFSGSVDATALTNNLTIYGDQTHTATFANLKAKQLTVGSTGANYANVVITDGQLGKLVVGYNGVCEVNGGKIDAINTYTYYASSTATEPSNTATLTINGGLFKSNEVTVTNKNHTPASETVSLDNYVAEGKMVISNTNETTKTDYPYTIGDPVASIATGEGESTVTTYYATLADAIKAATGEEQVTIKLLADISFASSYDDGNYIAPSQKIKLDLNNHVLTLNNTYKTLIVQGDLEIVDTSESTEHHYTVTSGSYTRSVDLKYGAVRGYIYLVKDNEDTDNGARKLTLTSGNIIDGGINGGTVVLNGGEIAYGTIGVLNANLTIKDGVISYNDVGIEGGTVTQDGGYIRFNGIGVNNTSGSTYVMNDGHIYENGAKFVNNGKTDSTKYSGGVKNNGTFTFNGGFIYRNDNIGAGNYSQGAGIYMESGTLNITGSSSDGCSIDENKSNIPGAGIAIKGGTVNISGGQVSDNEVIKANSNFSEMGAGIMIYNNAVLNVTGGYISNNYAVYSASDDATKYYHSIGIDSGELNISGGHIAGQIKASSTSSTIKGAISGGYFDSIAKEKLVLLMNSATYTNSTLALATRKEFADNTGKDKATYPYMVADEVDVAKIGDNIYTSLAKAIVAASAGDEIQLLSDTTESVSISKNVVIDLNGHTITNKNTSYTVNVNSSCSLIIKDTSTNKTGSIVGKITNYGELQINGGTLPEVSSSKTLTIDSCKAIGKISITDGTTTINGCDSGDNIEVTGGAVTINNGTFKQVKVTGDNAVVDIKGGNFTADRLSSGYAVYETAGSVKLEGGYYTSSVNYVVYKTSGKLEVTGGYYLLDVVAEGNYVIDYSGYATITGGYYSRKYTSVPSGYHVVYNTDSATKEKYPYTIAKEEIEYSYKTVNGDIVSSTTGSIKTPELQFQTSNTYINRQNKGALDWLEYYIGYKATEPYIRLLGDSDESFTLPIGYTFDTNGKNYTGTVSAPEGYEAVNNNGIYTVNAKFTVTLTSALFSSDDGHTRIDNNTNKVSTCSGGGYLEAGTHQITSSLNSRANSNLTFLGWYEVSETNDYFSGSATKISTRQNANIIVDKDINLIAVYQVNSSATANLTIKNNNECKTASASNTGVYSVTNLGTNVTTTSGDAKVASFDSGVGIASVGVKYTQNDKKTVYWLNDSGHVIGIGSELNILVIGNMTVTAVTIDDITEKTNVSIKFTSDFNQVVNNQTLDVNDTDILTLPSIPNKIGYTAVGWKIGDTIYDGSESKTATEFTAYLREHYADLVDGNGIITIKPSYTRNTNETATVKVYVGNTVRKSFAVKLGDSVTLEASDYTSYFSSGYSFNGWKYGSSGGSTVSKNEEYTFVPSRSTTYNIYVDTTNLTSSTAVCTAIIDSSATYNASDEKYTYSATMAYDVPDDCTFVEAGIIYSKNAPSGGTLDSTYTYQSNVTKPNGTVVLDIRSSKLNTWYFQSYVIYTNSDGTNVTVKSGVTTVSYTN